MNFRESLMSILILTFSMLGVYLIVVGTNSNAIGYFIFPPKVLPGVVALYFSAILIAYTVISQNNSKSIYGKFRIFVEQNIGNEAENRQRNMFFVLTIVIIGFAFTNGSSSRYRVLESGYYFGLCFNILIAVLASMGLFGWLSSFSLSKKGRG